MKKPVRIMIWLVVIGGVFAIIAFTLNRNKERSKEELSKELVAVPYTVTAAQVEKRAFSDKASFRGVTEPNQLVTVYSETDGRVVRLDLQKGATVNKGQALAYLDRSVKAAASSINRLNYEKARSDHQRLSELLDENNASQQEVENARVQMETYAAQLRIAEKQLGQTVIHSPVSGVVIDKKANPGDYLQPGAALATVADLHTVLARVFVPELFITRVSKGMPVTVQADVYDGEPFTGRVSAIIPVANEAKAFPVEITIPNNRKNRLLAGMSVSATFEPRDSAYALIIPRTALAGNVADPFVYTIDAEKKPVRREVKLGRDFGTELEVVSGLSAGEIVITSGQANVEPGKVLRDYVLAK